MIAVGKISVRTSSPASHPPESASNPAIPMELRHSGPLRGAPRVVSLFKCSQNAPARGTGGAHDTRVSSRIRRAIPGWPRPFAPEVKPAREDERELAHLGEAESNDPGHEDTGGDLADEEREAEGASGEPPIRPARMIRTKSDAMPKISSRFCSR